MWTVEKHLQELKDMRRVAREENITDASLAEHLRCDVQSIFNITSGKTREGELREKVRALLLDNEVAAQWSKSLIRPCALEDQLPVQLPEPVETPVPPRAELPAGHTEADAMRAAWLALGISQGELAARFNRTGAAINSILKGHLTKGVFYDALRAHLLEGKPAKYFEAWHTANKGDPGTATNEPKPVAQTKSRVVIVPMPERTAHMAGDYDTLMAQAMAAEELAEALKDLALLRQAEHRHAAAVAIARNVGLVITVPGRKTEAA